jgi:zinc transporter ZupT
MIDFIQYYSPITQALIATLFTWGVTAAGASLVFFTKTVKPKLFFMWEAVLVEKDLFKPKHIFVVCLPQVPLVFVIEPYKFSH